MKNFTISLICIIAILGVLLRIDNITDKVISFAYPSKKTTINANNPYYKDNNFEFVSNIKTVNPYGKQDLLNKIYSIINNHIENFTFYCPKEYKSCNEDMNNLSKDANLLTHLNNFVHPFNSFLSINTTIADSGEINLSITYLYSEDEINAINNEIDKILPEVVPPTLTDDYNKIKAIHDYIINNTKYDLANNKDSKSYKAYGPLFNHLAICNGYTDLMAIFLTRLNYDNFKIATTSNETGKTEGHVWNAVKLNNEWLHLDLTWDDPVPKNGSDENYLYHKYFLINSEELKTADNNITSRDHEFDPTIYSELKALNN